jgi:hypothetical protein
MVSVAAGAKEGPVDTTDFHEARSGLSILGPRAHFTSFITISHTIPAKKAPGVSFVHGRPGAVETGIFRGSTGVMSLVRILIKVLGPFIYIPSEKSGERHLFLATSATYPAGLDGDTASGVPLVTGVAVARGTDGKYGSGVYSVDQSCESAGPAVEEILAKMKRDGILNQVWVHTEDLFKRITGLEAV